MEQQSRHRRKLDRGDEPNGTKFRQHGMSAKTIKSYGILLCPLISCLFVLLVFWRQYSTPLKSIGPVNTSHAHHQADLHIPEIALPGIELHSEEHSYRDAKTQHLDWKLSSGDLRPDGVLKRVHLINGLFPGPTIEARPGDRLIINVTNNIQEPLSIHWHGLHVENNMDGVVGVTQCGISPGSSFIYNFTIPDHQHGTFWYHAHSGLTRADGLYGGVVVHEPASKTTVRDLLATSALYDKEYLLLIGDWYHRPAEEVMSWYMRAGSFGNDPVPDSLLINGIGHYNCSMAVPARPVDCVEQHADLTYLHTEVNTAYRLRIVNTGSLVGFTIHSQTKSLSVIEVDSINVEKTQEASSAGILYPGQRMDLVLRLPTEEKTSALTIEIDPECMKYPNPALTPNQLFAINPKYAPEAQLITPDNDHNFHLDIQHIPSPKNVLSSLPGHTNITDIVYVKTQKFSINHNVPYGYFNHTSWSPQQDPPMPLNGLPRAQWDRKQLALVVGHQNQNLDEPVWVDLVVNNLDDTGHPFHLHGHHFYVLTVYKSPVGWGSYNPFSDSFPPGSDPDAYPDTNGLDLSRAMLRDNVYIPSRAYAVLRFRANNPGTWLFHCHILWHLSSGMAMLVDVGDYEGFPGTSCLI